MAGALPPEAINDACLSGELVFVITCEHGGNRVPSPLRPFFRGHEALLHTHRGRDFGALRTARDFAQVLSAPLFVSTVSRLVADLNRSHDNPDVFSEATCKVSREIREAILEQHYRPYRAAVETCISAAAARGATVVHLSCHSFTPELHGEVRQADVGFLYDPARFREDALCRQWQAALNATTPSLHIRMNYPYLGTSDGFTTHLRTLFPAERYLGLELEINQKHVFEGGAHWQGLRRRIVDSFRTAVAAGMTAAKD